MSTSKRKTSTDAARARVLAQWRGVDYVPLETARTTPAKPVGALLPDLMKELRLEDRQADAEIVKVWNSLIDPAVTAHAQPVNLHKGTLFVNVDSNAWLSMIGATETTPGMPETRAARSSYW